MRLFSHDVLVPKETVPLNPFAIWRDPGHICETPRSAIRTLQIIELLASSKRPLRAIEIVRTLGLSPSSVNQLLKIMMDWGYLIFDAGSKRYWPSPRLERLGIEISGNYFGPRALEYLMHDATQRLGLSIAISTCQGTFMQVVDHLLVPGEHPEVVSDLSVAGLGLHVPLFGSCTGAAWLSRQSKDAILDSIRHCRRDLGQKFDDPDAILKRLSKIREQGYAFGGMSTADNIRSLAIPLPPASQGIILVACISGVKEEMDQRREEIVSVVREAIDRQLKPNAEDIR